MKNSSEVTGQIGGFVNDFKTTIEVVRLWASVAN